MTAQLKRIGLTQEHSSNLRTVSFNLAELPSVELSGGIYRVGILS